MSGLKRGKRVTVQGRPGIGQHDTSAEAGHEGHLVMLLQAPDNHAYTGLANLELLGRLGHALTVGNLTKYA